MRRNAGHIEHFVQLCAWKGFRSVGQLIRAQRGRACGCSGPQASTACSYGRASSELIWCILNAEAMHEDFLAAIPYPNNRQCGTTVSGAAVSSV